MVKVCIGDYNFKVCKPCKKLTLVYKCTTAYELMEYMKPKFKTFVRHNFVAQWQDKDFKICIKSFPIGSMVLVVDFAKKL